MMDLAFIEARIPHRPPFLWLDRVLELSDTAIRAEKHVPGDLPLFQGRSRSEERRVGKECRSRWSPYH